MDGAKGVNKVFKTKQNDMAYSKYFSKNFFKG